MPTPAKSIRLQIVDGNKNHRTKDEIEKRMKNEDRLKMSADNIEPPPWLDKTAKAEFNRIKALLLEIELINDADVLHLALYCDSYSQYLSYKRQVKKKGMWVSGKPNPFILRMKDAAIQMRSFGADLGLSPAARAKLAINLNGDDADEDDDF
ncbi:phage terminase small subunit P27 family [Listeria booriae]|uniref:Phage terminase small subunit P27 family n=1 Tax=Listeria booriae TaxID=1552123 RepID=A0A842AGW6_9LIST|nr:phage terminase small subunit P27 family [Listeria booriae]MBC1615318.1 phage terminase small subunit P27 family [Listeria booriae]